MCIAMMSLASLLTVLPAQSEHAMFGATLDAGVPDGVQAALVFRPWSFLRAHAGGGYNLVGPGVRGGLTLIPLDTTFRPTLSLEAGRYFAGDLSAVNALVPIGDMQRMRIAYDWASALLGLELDWGGGAFFIQGGVTRIFARVSVPELDESMNARVFAPTAKLGFITWFN